MKLFLIALATTVIIITFGLILNFASFNGKIPESKNISKNEKNNESKN